MGLPKINIIFKEKANKFISVSQKGTIAVILIDASAELAGVHRISKDAEVDSVLGKLGAENKAYLHRAFLGYVKKPTKMIVYVQTDGADLTAALEYMATQQFDYLVGPESCTAEQAKAIKEWVVLQIDNDLIAKAVLPDTAADNPHIINFATSGIKADGNTYTAAQYCSRVAGLIIGTPIEQSCTNAPLTEVTDITRLSKDGSDAAIDAGKLILVWDGEKVKVARGVTSFTTTTDTMGESFKKIKIVEAVDTIKKDLKLMIDDDYIGKYPNTYLNKLVLITAVKEYFGVLEKQGVLKSGYTVDLDTDAIKEYLYSKHVDVDAMSDKEIREADTGSNVFISASIKILDAIEDVTINIGM